MPQNVLEKYLWLNNSLFEGALRKEFNDDTVFVKTFKVSQAVMQRNQSYWCDVINVEINYTNSTNAAK